MVFVESYRADFIVLTTARRPLRTIHIRQLTQQLDAIDQPVIAVSSRFRWSE